MTQQADSEREFAIIKRLYELGREIERLYPILNNQISEPELAQIFVLLTSLSLSSSEESRRIAKIQDHLFPQMDLRHFLNFMVPVERYLGIRLSDQDFFITSTDQSAKVRKAFPLIFVLDNIRSAFNVGSIFRLADGIGVMQIHLCGYSPEPDEKTALGTEKIIPFLKFPRLENSMESLRQQDFSILGLETANQSTSLYHWQANPKTALVVGNERFGLTPQNLSQMDAILSLPMDGVKNSLNVSNALSIVAFEWKRQYSIKHHG